MRLEYHPATVAEFLNAVAYYERLRPGLGEACRAELTAALEQIQPQPHRRPVADGEIRRCLVKRFPLAIHDRLVAHDVIRILVIRHHRRRPDEGGFRN